MESSIRCRGLTNYGTVMSSPITISVIRGNLTAVRDADAIERKPLELFDETYDDEEIKHLSTHYPEKILVTDSSSSYCVFSSRDSNSISHRHRYNVARSAGRNSSLSGFVMSK